MENIIEEITFSTVFKELKQYRPGYKLEVQIDCYWKLMQASLKYGAKKERVITKINLLKILEQYIKRVKLN